MGKATLVLKNSFLEYVLHETSASRSTRAYTDTDLIESGVSMAAEGERTAQEPLDEAGPQCWPQTPMLDAAWPQTPVLDAMFEPLALPDGSGCSDCVDMFATAEVKAALGLDRHSLALGGGMWLPEAAFPLDQFDPSRAPVQDQWSCVYGQFGFCGWQGAFGEAAGVWDPSTPSTASGDSLATDSASEVEGHAMADAKTTVMLRNLPKALTRDMLVRTLDRLGFAGVCDFVYVPIEFTGGTNLGYALVNVTSPRAAARVWAALDGFRGWELPSDEACSVSWSDPHQGLSALVEKYRNSPVMHQDIPDEWRPALFSCGMRAQFPEPTKAIKAPKVRSKKTKDA